MKKKTKRNLHATTLESDSNELFIVSCLTYNKDSPATKNESEIREARLSVEYGVLELQTPGIIERQSWKRFLHHRSKRTVRISASYASDISLIFWSSYILSANRAVKNSSLFLSGLHISGRYPQSVSCRHSWKSFLHHRSKRTVRFSITSLRINLRFIPSALNSFGFNIHSFLHTICLTARHYSLCQLRPPPENLRAPVYDIPPTLHRPVSRSHRVFCGFVSPVVLTPGSGRSWLCQLILYWTGWYWLWDSFLPVIHNVVTAKRQVLKRFYRELNSGYWIQSPVS